jgi:hypothetical protein
MLAARVARVAEETALLSPWQRDIAITEKRPDRQGVRLLARYDRCAETGSTRPKAMENGEAAFAPDAVVLVEGLRDRLTRTARYMLPAQSPFLPQIRANESIPVA